MKITSIVGARPQFIKCSALSPVLRKGHREVIIHTGQHYDYRMSRIFFEELSIPEPDYHLGVGSGSHGYQLGEMVRKTEEVLLKEKPDLVLVFGDTNSTLAGALAAAKLHIKIGHVEAGLRSFDKSMPEEINRVLTDHCSDLLFCPTESSVHNLEKEHILSGVHLTGDVMADALLSNRSTIEQSRILEELGLTGKSYLLATIHRQSNTDIRDNLTAIVKAFCRIDETIVFPLHPRTEKFLKDYGLYEQLTSNVKTSKPLGYVDFLKLLGHARKVLTDSGGVQKEAYILGVPCITLRDTTEWVETVTDGWNILVGTEPGPVLRAVKTFEPAGVRRPRYEAGACQRIAEIIEQTG